jgi:hypothetical protein
MTASSPTAWYFFIFNKCNRKKKLKASCIGVETQARDLNLSCDITNLKFHSAPRCKQKAEGMI